MIIPVRCFSCGKPIAHLWKKYNEEIKKGRNPREVLDELDVTRYCCRTIFLTHRDVIKNVGKFKP
ncbi:MAG: DNA-directed RNA polymerase subunit N [Candidatus Aenigmatarchaeota archaeon]